MKSSEASLTLVVRREFAASAERLFDAWTRAEELLCWWGPQGVRCGAAEIDLRVGGRYRIANQFPDGSTLWISGEFLSIERPHRLEYTWNVGQPSSEPERVSVQFVHRGARTEVVITHQRIPDPGSRSRHEQGWLGCLEGLAEHADSIKSGG